MKKVGLCLTGGGGKGAYQIGAVQALDDLGLYKDVEAYAGTSIGAANASVLVSSSITKARKVWFTMPDNALNVPKPIRERIKEERLKVLENGIFSMDVFEETMLRQINHRKISKGKLFITISEVGDASKGLFEMFKSTYKHYVRKNRKAHYIALHDAEKEIRMDVIKASCAIPVIFSPVTINKMKYYDGGMFDNTPVAPLIEIGCDVIYVIDISFIKQPVSIMKKYPDVTFHVIKPKSSIGGILDFSSQHSKEIYQRGYDDTMAYFNHLQEKI